MTDGSDRVCFALDVPSLREAERYVDLLSDHVGAFKVGLELFIAARSLPRTEKPLILDLKLHDIPETVARAVRAAGDLGVRYVTLHVQQRKTLEMALKEAEPFGITLLGVTVLTSMTRDDLLDLGVALGVGPAALTLGLVSFAQRCGMRGFVCSACDVRRVRTFADGSSFLLVPGVRPVGADAHDQERVGTPAQAVKDGASMIVVGRPIRDAPDPVQAAMDIAREIDGAAGCT